MILSKEFKEYIDKIDYSEFSVSFNKNSDYYNKYPISECDNIYVLLFDGKTFARSFNTPMKKEITLDWLLNKINKESSYINLSKYLKSFISGNGLSVYPASYGIGLSCIFNSGLKDSKEEISNILDSHNIVYRCEFSEARWVYRFVISKSSENIEKIKSLKSS